MVRKTAAQDTTPAVLEGQTDAVAEVGFEQVPDEPETQGPAVDSDAFDGETYDPTAQQGHDGHTIDVGVPDQVGEDKPEGDAQQRQKLRYKAEREVLDAHRDEFNEVATRVFAEAGFTYARKLTEKEKAAKQIADLIAQYPDLRAEFPGVGPAAAAAAPPEGTVVG